MSHTATADSSRRERTVWCFYDFANSAFPTVIVTAVYVLYFKDVVLGGARGGYSDYLWGISNSAAAFIVFLTAPLLGAVADLAAMKSHFLRYFTIVCCVATGMLALTGPGTVALAVGMFIVAVVGFESSLVFYNAFLPQLVPEERMGRLSGDAWALGYIGGLACLLLTLLLVDDFLSSVPLLVAAWYLIFSIPVLVTLRDRRTGGEPSLSVQTFAAGARRMMSTVRHIKSYPKLSRFLTAYFFYNNAVITIIVFAVAFSADSLHFTTRESILLIVVMNLIAAPGAWVFGRVADRIGALRTLVIALVIWLVVVAGAEASAWPGLFSAEGAKMMFWGVAALASLAIGAVQATSRSYVGQLAPEGRSGEFYGFMAFAGKGSAILGPMVFGLASEVSDSQRVAVLTIGVFFAVGLALLLRIPKVAGQKAA